MKVGWARLPSIWGLSAELQRTQGPLEEQRYLYCVCVLGGSDNGREGKKHCLPELCVDGIVG